MSMQIMALCWPLEIAPTAKSVLISLADNANDAGVCWPSIPTICKRTCFSERAVHRAIRDLEVAGLLVADRGDGRHTRYTITASQPPQHVRPRTSDAPADAAVEPPQQRQSPPQIRQEPPQQVRSNPKKPSRTVKATVIDEVSAELLAELPAELVRDFQRLRQAKKAPITPTAVKGIIREAGKAGVSLRTAVEACCERGWGGFKAEWYVKIQNQPNGARHATNHLSLADRAAAIHANRGREPDDWIDGTATPVHR
jgi:hypothetical protein